MTSLVSSHLDAADLVVVGAGIVGLAHAAYAVEHGASVVVVDRDARAVGASVRNFGHACITAQADSTLDYAMRGRRRWLSLAERAGFWLSDAGTVVVARNDFEYTVLEDFAGARDDTVILLGRREVAARVPVSGAVGGAWFPLDLRVDPRTAVEAIASWLAGLGVRFHWSTAVGGVEPGLVRTSRGDIRARHTVVAVGHDVDQLLPDLAADHGVTRCSLHMLAVDLPSNRPIEPAVLTGSSMLRYPGFAVSPALDAVRRHSAESVPESVAAGLNLMFTQRPDGTLLLGDTHEYSAVASPFRDERADQLVLSEAARLLGVEQLTVRQRWQGIYASAPEPFLVAAPCPDLRVVSVTSGIGMTTAFGLAEDVASTLLG